MYQFYHLYIPGFSMKLVTAKVGFSSYTFMQNRTIPFASDCFVARRIPIFTP